MASVSADDLECDFEMFGLVLRDRSSINRILDMCSLFDLTSDDMVAEFVAFTSGSLSGRLDVTGELVDKVEQKLNTKNKMSTKNTPLSLKPSPASYYGSGTPVTPMDQDDDDMLSSYGTPINTDSLSKRKHTPDALSAKRKKDQIPRTLFSPPSQSMKDSSSSEKFSTRTNAGQVAAAFGGKTVKWSNDGSKMVEVGYVDKAAFLRDKYPHVYENMWDKITTLTDLIEDMEPAQRDAHKIEAFLPVASTETLDVCISGRICCSDGNETLSTGNVVLEGCKQHSDMKRTKLDVTPLDEYSFFPGQVIAMTGNNRTGNVFSVQKVHSCIPPPFPQHPVEVAEEEGPIQFVACCGPHTLSENMLYEPLNEMLRYVKEHKPHVFILMGPFVDMNHPHVKKGLMEETYEDLFNNWINYVASCLSVLPTHIIIVPSVRDVHHDSTYPVPPFSLKQNWKNVHLVAEPSLLNIEGIVIGLTSTDVLFHLSREELFRNTGSSDRMARLVRHIFVQSRFYPIIPPREDLHVQYDKMKSFGSLPVLPHILLLPSRLSRFIKDVDGCVVMNPEHLSKDVIGGSFVRFQVIPGKTDSAGSIKELVVAEVVKI